MMIDVPRSGCTTMSDERHGRHHEQPRDVIHREPVRSALTVRRDRQDQNQYRELTRLYLEDADAVPPLGARGRLSRRRTRPSSPSRLHT